MSQDVTLINTYYPIEYFVATGLSQTTTTSPTDFWASTEELPPTEETLEINFGRVRPLNFIDFEICAKPIDILVEYDDGTGNWISVVPDPYYAQSLEVQYLPSKTNPWTYIEHHFTLIQAQFIRMTFIRRDDRFPLPDSDSFPWSIEVRNARFMNVIQTIDEFVDDTGTDILGNAYRTDVVQYVADNIIDNSTDTLWQSQPNPSPFAVEALYFDLRINTVPGTMANLDLAGIDDLDTRSQADMESYRAAAVIVDEVFIDPVTFGPSMTIYYSMDDTPEWDNKLWIPINRRYVLQKGFMALPSPIFAKFMKLEFSNLSPLPYPIQEYPQFPQLEYRKFPTWVQNYFEDLTINPTVSNFIDPVDRVSVDPLSLGFQIPSDALTSGLDSRDANIVRSTDQEIRGFLSDTTVSADQTPVEDQIQFNSPFMYQIDLITELDSSRALTRFVQAGESGWNAETTPPTEPPPTVQSVPDLSEAYQEKTVPDMYFPYKCRHKYQTVRADRPGKIAYFVSIRDIGFYRRDYTAKFDEEYYVETFEDTAHFGTVNDFTQDDWRFVITP